MTSPALKRIQSTYQQINYDTLQDGILKTLYTDDAEFIDPFHHLKGLGAIETYFIKLYQNVSDIAFAYGPAGQIEHLAWQEWTMTIRHPKLAKGAPVAVPGITRFELINDKIIVHRDYFDAGALLYEQIPVLGSIIRTLKQRMGQNNGS